MLIAFFSPTRLKRWVMQDVQMQMWFAKTEVLARLDNFLLRIVRVVLKYLVLSTPFFSTPCVILCYAVPCPAMAMQMERFLR